MGKREKTRCQKRKSSVEKPEELSHNAEATKKENNHGRMTNYVNSCNYSTPDIVENSEITTDILRGVYIKTQLIYSEIWHKMCKCH